MKHPSPAPCHPLSRARPSAVLAVVAALVATLVPTLATTAAAAPDFTVSARKARFAEARDFATDRWSDPWDFSNDLDLEPVKGFSSGNGVTKLNRKAGKLNITTEPGGYVDLAYHIAGAIPTGRDTAIEPISAGTYKRLSFRMWTDLPRSRPGAVLWFTCRPTLPDCQGGHWFDAMPGWHTYDLELSPNLGGAPEPWSGQITGLRLIPANGNETVNVTLDWARLYEPSGGVNVDVPAAWADGATVYWDRDTNRANNTADNPNWGPVGDLVDATSISFNASAYPSGHYWFYAVNGSDVSSYSDRFRIDAAPRPTFDWPNASGATDWASAKRRDKWDFSQPSDVTAVVNATHTFADGLLDGRNAGPNANDNQVHLNLSGRHIDASKFHRLSFRIWYGGQFSLEDSVGGGMMMRLIWQTTSSSRFQELNDVVVLPGWNTINVDLATDPPSAILDEFSHGSQGWAGHTVRFVRFEPNEDRGTRRWKIDWIRISSDPVAKGDTFTFKLRDRGYEPGTVGHIYMDTNRKGFNGAKVASNIAMKRGRNSHTADLSSLSPGTYWPWVKTVEPSGRLRKVYADAPVVVR